MGTSMIAVVATIIGASLGSFTGCCAYRIPRGISIVAKRSFCDGCRRPLVWYELVPFMSYLLLRGRCSTCRRPIPFIYLMLEVAGAGVAVFSAFTFGLTIRSAIVVTFAMLMILIALIDWRHLFIPNKVVALGLAIAFLLKAPGGSEELSSSLVSALASLVFMGMVKVVGSKLLKREAMGLGDVKLSAVIGAFAGFEAFLVAVWLSSLAGAVYGLSLARSERQDPSHERLPYGAFLSVSSIFTSLISIGITVG